MIVLDASTLILLAKTELLEPFLAGAPEEVAIPVEVAHEASGAKRTLDALLVAQAIAERRIAVHRVKDRRMSRQLCADFGLGQGEAAALALALSRHASLVGIDDRNGIAACKLLRLPFTTAINILLGMRLKGLIDEPAAHSKLDALARHRWYKEAIVAAARAQLEGTS